MAITKEDIINVVKEANLNLSADLSTVNPDEELIKQGLDSLDMANLLFEMETAFNIQVSDESLANGEWRTLNKIVNSINSQLV